MTTARILVTGATGRIGLPFATRLAALGHEVRAIALPDDLRAPDLDATGTTIVEGSITSPAVCEKALADIDVVYHLAGQLPQNASDESIFDVNVLGSWTIAKAAASTGKVRLFVFASTDDVYSSVDPQYLPVDENHPRRPVSTYGLSKVIGEEIFNFYRVRRDLPVAIARFGLTQLAHELLTGITAHMFLLSARVETMRRQSATDPAIAALTAELESVLRARGEHAIAVRGNDGLPWIIQICEVSDLVEGLVGYLDKPAAIGDRFNMGGPAPFASDVAAAYLSDLTGLPTLDVTLPGDRLVIDESIARARSIIGYAPIMTIERILDRAVETVGLDALQRSGIPA